VNALRLRSAATALALSSALLLAGCGSFWPWGGSSKPKPADPPAVTAPVPARIAWTVRVGPGGAGFAPALAGDSVYAAGSDGNVARIDAASGRVLWQVGLGKRLSAGVGSDGDVVVVAARDGNLIALDADGKQKWTAPLVGEASTVPVVGQGVVLVRSSDNRVSAFELDSGKRRWAFQRQNPPLVLHQTSRIAIASGSAYVGLPGGRLVALSLQNGAVRWEATVSQPRGATEIERIADVVGTPVVVGREVCAASFQGRLACFDAANGRQLWMREVPSSSGIDFDARLVAIVDDRDVVHAFSRTGTSLWKQDKYARRELSAPLSLGPVLVMGDVEGMVHLLARDDGAVAGRLTSDGSPIVSPPLAVGRSAVLQTSAGSLVAVALD